MRDEAVDLRWLLAVGRRWFWLIAICALLGLAGAFAVDRWTPPVYNASVTLLIQAAVTDFQAVMTSERLAQTYSQLLKGRPVLERVIQQLDLPETPARLAEKITVNVIAGTQLIRVTVEHTNPNTAAAIANTLVAVFTQDVEALQLERYSDSLTSMQKQMADVEAEMETTQTRIDLLGRPQLPEDQLELQHLETTLASYRNTYTTLLQGYEQMRLTAAQSTQSVTVVETAWVPEIPEQQLFLYMTLAGAVGAMVGTGAAFLLEYLDDTIKTSDDAKRTLGLETLGAIGPLSRGDRGAIVATQSHSPHAEAFRVLSTNVSFARVDRPIRTLLITSPGPGEGKSLITANLAAAMAQAGLRVVVVDADLRRPTLGRFFALDPHYRGLAQALTQGGLDSLLQPTPVEGLSVLTDGELLPPNPTQLLGSQRMGELLNALVARADIILIDSPPVLPVADTALLARQVDGLLLVLRAGQTRWQAARQAVDRLHQVGATVTGVVLNAVPMRSGGYYGGYYSSYHGRAGGNGEQKGTSAAAHKRADANSGARLRGLFPSRGTSARSVEEQGAGSAMQDARDAAAETAVEGDISLETKEGRPLEPLATAGQAEGLQGNYGVFARRSLAGFEVEYLFLATLPESVGKQKSGKELLCAWAICADGRNSLLHFAWGDGQAQGDWPRFLADMVGRGLPTPVLIVSGGAPDLISAAKEVFPASLHQHCLVRKMQNLTARVPASARAEIRDAVQAAYYAPSRQIAELIALRVLETYQGRFVAAMQSFRDDWESCIAYLSCPPSHHKHIRTINLLERTFQAERRRSRTSFSPLQNDDYLEKSWTYSRRPVSTGRQWS